MAELPLRKETLSQLEGKVVVVTGRPATTPFFVDGEAD
jgi:hypothetical protein